MIGKWEEVCIGCVHCEKMQCKEGKDPKECEKLSEQDLVQQAKRFLVSN